MARKMKDSGIEWIGEIPEDWEIGKIGQLYIERKEKVSDRDYSPLSVTMQGIVPQLSTAAKTDAHDDRKLLCKGDFAINSRSDRRGSCGISNYTGSVSLINTVLMPKKNMYPRYYDWLFHTTMFSDEYYKWGHGIVDDLWTTRWQDMKNINIIVPSISEQQRTADFLDKQCAEIDTVLEKTRASIEEYKKLKQSVITQAVTKGIRPNRPMKDSGIEWIGEIPEDWEISKIKYGVTKVGSGKTPSGGAETYADKGVLFLRSQNVYNTGLVLEPATYITEQVDEEMKNTRVQPRDVLLNITGGSIGRCCIFPEELQTANVNQHVSIIRVIEGIFLPEYMHYYWLSALGTMSINLLQTGGNREGLSADAIKNSLIPILTVEEQHEIIGYLDEKCIEIDKLILKKEQFLSELESYKKSLIYEYVTGKKEILVQSTTATVYQFPANHHASKPRFAQAVLVAKILDGFGKQAAGRVKLEKSLYTIETHLGFNFDTNYIRQVAGPLDHSVYDCEAIICKYNNWFTKNKNHSTVVYKPTKNKDGYKKYYEKYFSEYNSEIERIIAIFRDCNMDKAEKIATVYAAWNDHVIAGTSFSDKDVVDDILNHWHKSKERFSREEWLDAMEFLRNNNLIPRGYGKPTQHVEM